MKRKVEDFWREKLLAWKDSGDSISDFCKTNGLHVGSFYKWRKRLFLNEPLEGSKSLTKQPFSKDAETPSFVEVDLPFKRNLLLPEKVLRITTSYGAVIEVPL